MAQLQTFKNHTRILPPFHFFVLPVLLGYVLNACRHLWLAPSLSTGFGVLVAAALLMTALLSRVQAITVQDRLIRLEMRLRLRALLPADMQSRVNELTPKQLVGLRFASDPELPELVRDVLEGRLEKQVDIKKRVKNWQADYLRA
jgi:hypothetical protein